MAYQDPQKRAQAELDELTGQMETGPAAAVEGDDPSKAQPAAAAPAAPEPGPAAAAAQPEAAPKAAEQTPQLSPEEKIAALEARNATLQGKYNKEIPRALAESRRRGEYIVKLEAEVKRLRSAAQVNPAPAPESDAYKLLVAEYGEPAAKAMLELTVENARAAKPVEETVLEPLLETDAATAQQALNSEIAAHAGDDWLEVNESQGFIDWSHVTKNDATGEYANLAMNRAYAAGDAQAVATFFNAYKAAKRPPEDKPTADNAAANQPTPEQLAMQAPDARANPNPDVEDPNAPKGGGKWFTLAETEDFYNEVAKGRWVGREAEVKVKEAEIMDAMANGRISE